MDQEKLKRFWRIVGLIATFLMVILVAGAQLIDLIDPDFR